MVIFTKNSKEPLFENENLSYKNLNSVVINAVINKSVDCIYDLENLLRQHKPSFFSLFKPNPKNPSHKDVVLNSAKEGIFVAQQNTKYKIVIPQQMVDESLLISEMFNISELNSLEFIIMASNQEPRFPGLSRGPIAVFLYYDSIRSLLNSIKLLVQAKNGRSWSTKINREILKLIDSYTDDLLKSDIISGCLKKLFDNDITTEFDMLQKNQAFGSGKYKQRLVEIIREVRQLYADIIFAYAAQTNLKFSDIKQIIEYLFSKSEVENGCLDKVSITLLLAYAYTIDISIIQTCDENDLIIKELPVVSNPSLLEQIKKEISNKESNIKGIDVILNFIWAITTKTLALFPINSLNSDFDDEIVIDECIEKKVFDHFTNLVISSPLIESEEYFLRRIHVILSDFIGLMPLKVKELRDKGDEIGRIIGAYLAEGLQPPDTLSRHFESLLNFIAEVYKKDNYNLSDEIWKITSEDKQIVLKFVNFHKFISSTIDSYLPQILHKPLLNLLTSFSQTSPSNIYNILKSSINQNSQFSLEQIFNTFNNYYFAFKGQDPLNSGGNLALQSNNTALQRNVTTINLKSIEIDILCATIKLIKTIVENDKNCCIAIAENQRYSCISTFTGLLLCPLPRKLKAQILFLLAGLAKEVSFTAFNIWLKMENIFPKPQLSITNFSHYFQQKTWQNGISVEIEDIEPKYEEYIVTIAYLECLCSLLKHLNYGINPQTSVQLNLNFVIDLVFIKSNSRVYKNINEKWIIQGKCLLIIHRILEMHESEADSKNFKDISILMSQILQENTLFRRIMEIIEDSEEYFLNENINTDEYKHSLVRNCFLESFKVLNLICEKENDFIDSMHNNLGFPISQLLTTANLFFQINHRTQKIDRLATLIKALSISDTQIQISILKLLQNLVSSNQNVSENLLLQIKPFIQYHEDYFLHCFVECCESDDKNLRKETLKFILKCLQKDILSNTSYGFSYKLFGFDRNKKSIKTANEPNKTYNCLDSIICILESDSITFTEERCLCMEILYTLCKDYETCNTVLRFLRTSYELLANYLENLQKKIANDKENWLLDRNISEIAWFLRILAIEIKTTSESSLKSNCNSYIKMLLGENAEKKLTNLIPDKIFVHVNPEMPKWEFFDHEELWKIMSEFTISENNSIDLKQLKAKLINEVKVFNLQLGVLQTNLIQKEIDKILVYASELNDLNTIYNSKTTYFEGWRELCEIMFTVDCLDFDSNSKTLLLLDVIQKLLSSVFLPHTVFPMISSMSSVLLLACNSLRTCQPEAQLKTRLISTANSIMNILESSSLLWNKNKRARVNFYASLIHIHKILPPSSANGIKLNFRLLEKICKDTLSGQELNKVLTMSVLIESNLSWIKEVADDGTLCLIMESLKEDDKEIKANKFDIRCKAFYSFETKMALLMKISSDPKGNRILKHLGIIEILSSLECFDLYSFLIGQSDICYKMVVSILRLLLSLNCSKEEQDIQQITQFLTIHSSIINDILCLRSPLKNLDEGVTVLTLITSLLSKLCFFTKKQIQTSFLNLIHNYSCKIRASEIKILVNILTGYVELVNSNKLEPLFAPIWDCRETFPNIGLPNLGLLVSIIENNIEKCRQSTFEHKIIELCIYLLWHHLNLYISVVDANEKQKEDIQRLLYEANRVISDMLFSKVQSILINNTFSDVFIRRIKRMITMVK